MHYRVNCESLEEFIAYLKKATMPIPFVPDYKIENWDNNLVRSILQTEEIEQKNKKE